MAIQEYNPEVARTFAARLGLLVAASWTISFLIVVNSFPSFLCDLGYIVGLMSIVIVGKNLRMFRTLAMKVNWWQGMSIALLAFMGGVLITTLAQFIYFAYFDHGQFLNTMQESLENPDMVKLMKEAGNSMLLDQMTEAVKKMAELSPRDFTLNLFSTNVTVAIIFSLICSLFRGKKQNQG